MQSQVEKNSEIDLAISGMSCASCASRIEVAVNKVPGVLSVAINLATERAHVNLTSKVTHKQIQQAIKDAGYGSEMIDHEHQHTEVKGNGWHVVFATLLSLPLLVPMILNFAGVHLMLPGWLQLALATPVQFWLGAGFYKAGWKAAINKNGNMDLLVTIGTTAAYGLSLYMLYKGSVHLYFEASSAVISLVLLGKWLEQRAKRQTTEAIRALQALKPDIARIKRENEEVDVSLSLVKVGDLVIVRPGERIPVDGLIIEGSGYVDEALITGESAPVNKTIGQQVTGGSVNLDALLLINTQVIGTETTLSRIIRLVEDAQIAKPHIQRLVDKVSAIFVPVVLVIAFITLVGWVITTGSWEQAILNAVAVLVIACPCALGLATPTAIMCGTGAAARYGILIKDANVLELALKVNTVVFDKTGTLTEGKPLLTALRAINTDEINLIKLAAALEKGSLHPLAKAVLDYATKHNIFASNATDLRDIAGKGVEAWVEDRTVYLGNERWMAELEISMDILMPFAQTLKEKSHTISWLAEEVNGVRKILGFLAFADEIKPVAKHAVSALNQLGVESVLLTGDNAISAKQVANDIGIMKVLSEQTPETKSKVIADLKNQGKVIAMVGDGINDAPALAIADVSFAMSAGSDIAMHTADVTLMRSDPSLVADTIDISRRTYSKIKQNLFWAFIYNLIGIPLAAFGLLNPVIAGVAMALSSVSVVTNSLMLKSWKPIDFDERHR
ncbi:MAG: heavy metal translocating P-type ATPase [Methylotenera sp.]|uniref:heavy metal translocating P-type ATPase n=1 Tax=Methylotenera sp. TaxID=2051956 RepID=UPI00248742BA|nr:heavy metal translocating P-type ATPase [Methylotenera sp.]MDI1308863.1 heavy metal translocating P-type ATPase [Methylotenera sp.]